MRDETEKGKKGRRGRKWGEKEKEKGGRAGRREGKMEGKTERWGGRNLNINWRKGYPVSIFSPMR